MAAASSPEDDLVLLRLVAPAGGVRKLEDSALPSTSTGRVVPPRSAASTPGNGGAR